MANHRRVYSRKLRAALNLTVVRMSVIGQTKIYARNKQTQQFMITRIFVIARERGPILLGNAACPWLGLITMLVKNKAPVVGKLVASVTREETESGEVEAYPLLKTSCGAEMTQPTSKPLIPIAAPKKKRTQINKAKPVANASVPLDNGVRQHTKHPTISKADQYTMY